MRKSIFDDESRVVRLKLAEADQEISSLGNLVRKLRSQVESSSKDVEKRVQGVEDQIGNAEAKVHKMSINVKEKDVQLQKMSDLVRRLEVAKAEHRHVKEISDRMKVFESIETIQDFETKMLPRIMNFTSLIDKLERSHDEMRAVIRGFDENISIKANKSTVQESISALDEKFIIKTDLRLIDERFTKVLKQIEESGEHQTREFALMRKE